MSVFFFLYWKKITMKLTGNFNSLKYLPYTYKYEYFTQCMDTIKYTVTWTISFSVEVHSVCVYIYLNTALMYTIIN